MPKTKAQKAAIVEKITAAISGAKGVVFANFQGLSIKDQDELRGRCKEQGIRYLAAKKTLLAKALDVSGVVLKAAAFDGGVAVVSAETDEVAPARIAAEFSKTRPAAAIFAGILDGAVIDSAQVMALSRLPGRRQLLGQLAGTINAPVSGFVNVLAGNIRGLLNALNAVREKKLA